MPVPKFSLNSALVLILTVLVITPARADIYRYQDEKGVWHFSNVKLTPEHRLYIRSRGDNASAIRGFDPEMLEPIIYLASKQFQVDKDLIKAVIKAESDFDHRAVSSKGAQGLMQLMPETADELNVNNAFDPKENILGGTRYLSLLLKRFNYNKTLALAAYNAGPKEVEIRMGIPPYPETRAFVKRVLTYYQAYGEKQTDE